MIAFLQLVGFESLGAAYLAASIFYAALAAGRGS